MISVLAWLSLFLSLGPLVLILSNLFLLRRPAPADGRPAVSVLIPARDEEDNIADAVRAVLASDDVELELVVLDDHSTDRTRLILDAVSDPRLRVIQARPLRAEWSGKQHACAQLAETARHDLMVFVDADVRLTPDALSRMCGFMQRMPGLGLASGFPHQVVESWLEQLLLPLIHFLLLGFLPIFAMNKSPAPALGAGCGQLFIARRAAYSGAGGHAAIRRSLHDGITLPRAFRTAGTMTGLFDADRLARCRMYTNAREVWAGLLKNATEGMATPMALPVWTAILAGGQVLPWLLLLAAPTPAAACAAATGLASRMILALRFRQPIVSALLHPLGVLALLAVQWTALLRAVRGVPATWRGRSYPKS